MSCFTTIRCTFTAFKILALPKKGKSQESCTVRACPFIHSANYELREDEI